MTKHPSLTPLSRKRQRPFRAVVASLTAALLVAGGSFAGATAATASTVPDAVAVASTTAPDPTSPAAAPPASTSPAAAVAVAAEPRLTVTPANDVDPAVSNTFTVTGTGYVGDAAVNGAYVVLGEKAKWAGEGPLPATGWAALGWVMPNKIVDGKFTTTLTIPANTFDPAKKYHVGTSAAHGLSATNRTLDAFAEIAIRQPAPVPVADPKISVSPSADIDPTVENTFTISGTGFVGDGAASGAYVVLGEKEKWSGNGPLPAAGWPGLTWVRPAQIVDGAFTTTLKIPANTLDPSKAYHVATSAAHGLSATNRTLDSFADLVIRRPAPIAQPKITVTPASDIDPKAAHTFTVAGTGFVGDAAKNGTYVLLGDRAIWSGTGPLIADGWLSTNWVMPRQIIDGAFSLTITIPADSFEYGVEYQVATSAAHGLSVTDRSLDTFQALTLKPQPPTSTPTPTPPTPPTTPTPPAAPAADPTKSGSLSWGVVASFRNYITGTIAKGSVSVSGGATSAGGTYQFGQSGGSFDVASGTGSASYSGAVRFVGHGGVLDVTLADPQIAVTSPTSGTLTMTVNGAPTTMATLNLAAAARSTTGNSVTYTNTPVTFTAAGSEVFQGRYPTGDPLTFTIGVAGAAPAGVAGTVAQASGASAATSTTPRLPATAPSSTGITLDDETRAKLIAGEEVTVVADGFQPNEKNIRVVVYSTPTVLASALTADASGIVTWTGKLPATLEPGTHTLTFQGSINKGVVFELPAAAALAEGSCLVENATLDWGFKESFRNYIEGIARGGWELGAGATYTYPNFGFTGGSGDYNPEKASGVVSFGGSIRFTGHDGALDTTLTNPQIEFVDDATAYILLDVAGTTQDGQAIADTAIRFAKLDLTKGAVSQDATSLTGSDIPAVLTDEGAGSFGTYAAGEALDPVSFAVPLPADCGVAAAPADAEQSDVTATDTTAELATPAAARGDNSWLLWSGAAALVLLAAIAAAWIMIARRRGLHSAATPGPADDGSGPAATSLTS